MSNIEWTELTWNPTLGCSEVSPGCRECYAAKMAHRLSYMPLQKENYAGLTKKLPNGRIVWTGLVKEMPERLFSVMNNKKPTTYFVDSMSDLFHKDVSFDFIDRVMVVTKVTPWHTYQILTKRPDRLAEYFSSHRPVLLDEMAIKMIEEDAPISTYVHLVQKDGLYEWPLKNVWFGTSVENQKVANERIHYLNYIPAAVKFLSCEPLIENINFEEAIGNSLKWHAGGLKNCISWVIVGGESGSNHRPCEIEWIESIVEQCKTAGVPVFVKQLGSYQAKLRKMSDKKGGNIEEFPETLKIRQFPKHDLQIFRGPLHRSKV